MFPFNSIHGERRSEAYVKWTLATASSLTILIVVLIFLFLFREAAPFLREPGLGALSGARWTPVSFQQQQFGILPLITGSLLVTALAGMVAVPLGILGAIYIAELAHPAERELLKPFIELLAAIPSVVLGFFGMAVLAPWLKAMFGLPSGMMALTGALVLGLMAAPTIISISEDAIRSVPRSYREASAALGATNMQTIWKVTAPAAMPGMAAATMLGLGRVLGETMAVLMLTGNAAQIAWSPFESVRTMTATIAAEMGEVTHGSAHYQALFWIGLVLLAATFVLNIIAQGVLGKNRMRS